MEEEYKAKIRDALDCINQYGRDAGEFLLACLDEKRYDEAYEWVAQAIHTIDKRND